MATTVTADRQSRWTRVTGRGDRFKASAGYVQRSDATLSKGGATTQ